MTSNDELLEMSLPIYSSQRTELRQTLEKIILDIETQK